MAACKAAVITWPRHIQLRAPPRTSFVFKLNRMQRRSVWVRDKMEFGPAVLKGYVRNWKGSNGLLWKPPSKVTGPCLGIMCPYQETVEEVKLVTHKSPNEQNVWLALLMRHDTFDFPNVSHFCGFRGCSRIQTSLGSSSSSLDKIWLPVSAKKGFDF